MAEVETPELAVEKNVSATEEPAVEEPAVEEIADLGADGSGPDGLSEQDAQDAQDAQTASQRECQCKYKSTERDDDLQEALQKRLNRVIGQLGGVKQMIDDNRYCGDVLIQLSAAESAIRKISEMVLQNHMQTCVVEQIRDGNDEIIDELMQLVHRFSR